MARNYFELKRFLERRYPQLVGRIEGENYPPPAYAVYAQQFTGMAQMASLAAMVCGDKLFTTFGMQVCATLLPTTTTLLPLPRCWGRCCCPSRHGLLVTLLPPSHCVLLPTPFITHSLTTSSLCSRPL